MQVEGIKCISTTRKDEVEKNVLSIQSSKKKILCDVPSSTSSFGESWPRKIESIHRNFAAFAIPFTNATILHRCYRASVIGLYRFLMYAVYAGNEWNQNPSKLIASVGLKAFGGP